WNALRRFCVAYSWSCALPKPENLAPPSNTAQTPYESLMKLIIHSAPYMQILEWAWRISEKATSARRSLCSSESWNAVESRTYRFSFLWLRHRWSWLTCYPAVSLKVLHCSNRLSDKLRRKGAAVKGFVSPG